ncbi:hypothetical protein C7M84_005386 [Penaeus vannamei]|uniref:Uncharacterized protein n=1 Tax=Penaeus vannamei TaxID=6689 RepID=A0A3R7MGR2_PENVA|nr:hypothetical protein C7M84_005386 [Penaeus vannamei]
MVEPVVIVHGGAWAVPEILWDRSIAGVKTAALHGYKVLQEGGSVVDVAEAAVEMDAIIMNGATMEAGAVAAIRNIPNPVKVARLIMEKTPHVMLAGEGANKFASQYGINEVDKELLITPYAKEELAEYKKYTNTVYCLFNKTEHVNPVGHDTVGCAVVDQKGHTACATSTGGITAKMPGRVGAVSTTGCGEAIMKACLARHIVSVMGTGQDVVTAIKSGLNHMETRINGFGGAIAVSCKGDVGMQFSTPRMPWAYVRQGKLHYGIHPGQHIIEDL